MAKKTAKESILREKTVKSRSVKPRITTDSRMKILKNASIISVVLVIAICIVGNLILSLTLDKALTFDTSSVKENTVSQFTRSYLRSIDKKVEIIGLFDKNDQSFALREYFIPILDDYEAKGDGKVDVKYVDPDVDPFILTELDPENQYGLEKYTYVVRCQDRLEMINPYTCITVDSEMLYYYGVQIPVTNNVELAFTSCIVYVSSERPLRAYYLDGHDCPAHSSMDTMLQMLGFTNSMLNLNGTSARIPDDCELLVILEPKTDLSPSEKELINSYLDNAGKVLLVLDYDSNRSVQYTNLNELTKRMGVTLENGVIHENSIEYLTDPDNPYSSIADVDPDYAEYIGVPDKYTVDHCRYLKVDQDKSEMVYVDPLVITSDTASVDFLNTQIDASASTGVYPVILQAVDTSKSQNSCMIIIGTSAFTSDSYYSNRTLVDNNATLMKGMIKNICPVPNTVLVPSKTMPSYVLSKPLSSSSATMWSIVVMTVIPLGSLICGCYIYNRRRHL